MTFCVSLALRYVDRTLQNSAHPKVRWW